MNETDSPDSKVGRFSEKVSRKDPLAILGLVILFIGVALIVYGFIPISQANYVQIASGPVPLTDASGNFITSPESYFQEHYTGTGSIDRVDCSPSVNGYYCYGFEFVGTVIKYSQAAKEYGAGILALGFVAIFVSSRLSPVEPNAKNHTRPITIRIDEDICISNGVCVCMLSM